MKITDFSIPDGSKVDIVVRARNGHEMTAQCLESIVRNTPRELYRLILVDDGSDPALDETPDVLVRVEESQGDGSASNLGIALAQTRKGSPYILLLDAGTKIPLGDSTWLQRMIAELEEGGEDCAAVGALTHLGIPPQHILSALVTYEEEWEGGSSENLEVPWLRLSPVLFRKEALEECGPLDAQYEVKSYAGFDISVQLRDAGWQLRTARSVFVFLAAEPGLEQRSAADQQSFYMKWGMGKLFDMGFIAAQELRRVLPC